MVKEARKIPMDDCVRVTEKCSILGSQRFPKLPSDATSMPINYLKGMLEKKPSLLNAAGTLIGTVFYFQMKRKLS